MCIDIYSFKDQGCIILLSEMANNTLMVSGRMHFNIATFRDPVVVYNNSRCFSNITVCGQHPIHILRRCQFIIARHSVCIIYCEFPPQQPMPTTIIHKTYLEVKSFIEVPSFIISELMRPLFAVCNPPSHRAVCLVIITRSSQADVDAVLYS